MGVKQINTDELELKRYLKSHKLAIDAIQLLDNRIDELAPFELAKLEYLYTKAERAAWGIAAWYKKKQKYYEGVAEIAQGQEFKKVRDDGASSTDAQYLSRIAKGVQLTAAADHEGDYIAWRGVAQTYERAANSIKDMMKANEAQGGN
ncbi:hypothetical protein [Siminovitchia terrae]|uniref:hypothetical protein n=1 Tax=Siminovitchia terrae TaxID=1914933 RepID=UPI001B064006|nr:hypothetical protein [Siminovitchia terrae]GIN93359.1 hypothetical protein J22TS1_44100 [Siminovitchia terrae]